MSPRCGSPREGRRGGERGATLEVFIHIGTRYTGTTSIQATLQANRAALADRGVFYLSSPGERDHRVLAACCQRAPRADDFPSSLSPASPTVLLGNFHRRFADEMARLPRNARVVVSSARLHSRLVHADEIAALRDLFTPFCERVTIIIALREQLDMARDSYAAALQGGNGEEMSRFLSHRCRPENPLYNHYETLRKWADVFGRENLRPFVFDVARRSSGSLGEEFLALVDPALSSCPITRQTPPDEPPDAFGQCLLRQLNQRLPRRSTDGDALNEAVARFIVAHTARRNTNDVPVDEDLAAAIRDRFAAGNELVRLEYFPRRALLFSPRADDFNADEPRLTREREALLGEVLGFFTEALRSQARQLRTRRPARSTRPTPVAQANPSGPSGPSGPAGSPGLATASGASDQMEATGPMDRPAGSFGVEETTGPKAQSPRQELADLAARTGHRANDDAGTAIGALDKRSAMPATILHNAPITTPRH